MEAAVASHAKKLESHKQQHGGDVCRIQVGSWRALNEPPLVSRPRSCIIKADKPLDLMGPQDRALCH